MIILHIYVCIVKKLYISLPNVRVHVCAEFARIVWTAAEYTSSAQVIFPLITSFDW